MIESERLRLVPATAADTGTLHALWTDTDVRRYLWDDVVIERATVADVVAESERLQREHGLGQWLVYERASERFVGFAGLAHFDYFEDGEQRVEILYGIYPAFWGQGLASEAARALIDHAFDELGLHEVWAGTDPPNEASLAVMKRLGMSYDRTVAVNDEGLEAIYYVLRR